MNTDKIINELRNANVCLLFFRYPFHIGMKQAIVCLFGYSELIKIEYSAHVIRPAFANPMSNLRFIF